MKEPVHLSLLKLEHSLLDGGRNFISVLVHECRQAWDLGPSLDRFAFARRRHPRLLLPTRLL